MIYYVLYCFYIIEQLTRLDLATQLLVMVLHLRPRSRDFVQYIPTSIGALEKVGIWINVNHFIKAASGVNRLV